VVGERVDRAQLVDQQQGEVVAPHRRTVELLGVEADALHDAPHAFGGEAVVAGDPAHHPFELRRVELLLAAVGLDHPQLDRSEPFVGGEAVLFALALAATPDAVADRAAVDHPCVASAVGTLHVVASTAA